MNPEHSSDHAEPCSLLYSVTLTFQENFQKLRENLSAVLLSPDQHLWLASDEHAALERLSPVGERTFGNHKSFQLAEYLNLPGQPDAEIDIEGLAFADDYLWLVGSHSRKRKQPNAKKIDLENAERLSIIESEPNRYLLARIPLVGGELKRSSPSPIQPDRILTAALLATTATGNLLIDALMNDPHLKPFLKVEIPGKENGFDIEGLAVHQNRIWLGLRGPVLRGWAIILELEVKTSDRPDLLKLKKIGSQQQRYKKYFLDLEGLGVREISIDQEDLLILAGPTMDLDGPVKLFRLEKGLQLADNAMAKPTAVLDIPYGRHSDHAEGITLFTQVTGKASILVVYDSPNAATRLKGTSATLADVFKLNA
jgi:hypothetical protein